MLKTFALVLIAIFMAAGSAEARSRSTSLSRALSPTCAAGLVKELCVCRAQNAPRRQVLCRSGHYCHPYDGACTQ